MYEIVTIEEAQEHLAELIAGLAPGQETIITSNDQPVAELRPLLVKRQPRFGSCKGSLVILAEQLFLIPAVTHRTNANERKNILQRFESGQYKAVVTSKVLNEGVDMPEAAVAIVLGGSGSAREHTQRLGRILRQRANKQAVLYEITARGTIETAISWRRRQTEAYAGHARKFSQL